MNSSPSPCCSCASSTSLTIEARVLFLDVAVAWTTRAPCALLVPANTVESTTFSTGIDSPVIAASLTADAPSTTVPSVAMFCPGRTKNRSPTSRSSISISRWEPSGSILVTCFGTRSSSARMALRVFPSVNDSSASEIEYKNANEAASPHSPSAAATTAATVIKSSIPISRSATNS